MRTAYTSTATGASAVQGTTEAPAAAVKPPRRPRQYWDDDLDDALRELVKPFLSKRGTVSQKDVATIRDLFMKRTGQDRSASSIYSHLYSSKMVNPSRTVKRGRAAKPDQGSLPLGTTPTEQQGLGILGTAMSKMIEKQLAGMEERITARILQRVSEQIYKGLPIS